MKTCNICNKEKPLSEFYSQNKQSKKRGSYIYHNPECKECTISKSARWNSENKDRQNEISRNYYKTEKGVKNVKRKAKKQKVYFKLYQKENLGKFRVYSQTRRAKKLELSTDYTEEDWLSCLEFFDHSCAYCGMSEEENKELYGKVLEQEHVIPVSKGGSYTTDNIIPSCRGCNASKYNKDFIEWYQKQDFFSEDNRERILFYLNEAENKVGEVVNG